MIKDTEKPKIPKQVEKHKQFDLIDRTLFKQAQDEFNPEGSIPILHRTGELRAAKRLINRLILDGFHYERGRGLGVDFVVRGSDSTTYAAETVFDSSKSAFKKIRTDASVGNSIFRMTTPGQIGQELFLKIENDVVANRTITFGSQFKVTGNLVGSTAGFAMLHFISDGVYYSELSRTTGLSQ